MYVCVPDFFFLKLLHLCFDLVRLGLYLPEVLGEPGATQLRLNFETFSLGVKAENCFSLLAGQINAVYEDGPVELPVLGQDEQQHRRSVLRR